MNTKPLTTAAAVLMQNRVRFNPMRYLSPERLSVALDSFKGGLLREAAQFWESMIERDDVLSSVEPKHRAAVSQRTWRIEKVPGADEKEAARHEACLQFFYNHSTAVNAYDRNDRGEFEKLADQMASATAMRYAVHHLVWKPMGESTQVEGGGTVPVITAEFEFVPLYFFENTTGILRYDASGLGVDGKAMDSREWMTTCGRGIMFAASICYTFKRLSFQDWTNFNERYAQGKVLGKTPAAEGTPEAEAMENMVEQFTGDMSAVVYGWSGDGSPIEVIEPKGTASVEAFSKFVERQDRHMATLFRGSDLGTMSAGDGDGTGVTAQKEETAVVERGSITMVGGALRRNLDRLVIEMCFGAGVRPLAYVRLDGEEEKEREDAAALVSAACALADRGIPVDAEEVAERLNVPIIVPENQGTDRMLLGKAAVTFPPSFSANAATANEADLITRTIVAVSGARRESVKPTGTRIATLIARLGAGDITMADFATEADSIAEEVPDLLTRELVMEIAMPETGALGASALGGVSSGITRINQVKKEATK